MQRIAYVLILLFFLPFTLIAQRQGSSVVAGPEYQGEQITADLPSSQHIKNIGSYRDGAGMCVMSSIEMAALFQGMEQYRGLRNWCAKEPGGAYPGKVDRQLAAYCKEKGLPPPKYLQYEGPNPETILDLIDKTGRMACITYGYSPRYGGTIAHMTCSPRFRGQYAVCLDNNYPGTYEWMSKDELIKRIKWPGRSGWVFVWLNPPPPQVPINRKQ